MKIVVRKTNSVTETEIRFVLTSVRTSLLLRRLCLRRVPAAPAARRVLPQPSGIAPSSSAEAAGHDKLHREPGRSRVHKPFAGCQLGVMAEAGLGPGLIREGHQRERRGSSWRMLACRGLPGDRKKALLFLVAILVSSWFYFLVVCYL